MYQRVVFFGSGEYVIPIIEKIRKKGLEFVVTTEKEREGEPIPLLISYLKRENIPYISSNLSTPDDIEKLKLYAPTLGILASYGAILKQDIIDLFIYGIFNIHPSLLPKYRGPSPIQSTILNNDIKTGVSIIRLNDKVDQGPLLTQKEIELKDDENYYDLRKRLFEIGADMIALLLEELRQNDHLVETPQEETNEPYTQKVTRQNGFIDLKNPPSPQTIQQMIKAYYPWPGVFVKTIIGGTEKIIKLLPDGKIQVEGKNPMTLKDFANGYQSEGREILDALSLAWRST